MSQSARPVPSLRRLKEQVSQLRDRHRARHLPTGFGFAFSDRIEYLDPARWDLVAANASVFLRRDVLGVTERHGPENIQPRYAMVFRGTCPVAIIATQIVTISGQRFGLEGFLGKAAQSRVVQRLLGAKSESRRSAWRERVLVAGNLLSWGCHGVAFASGEDSATLWPAVAEALYRIRRAERLAGQADFAMVKDIASGDAGIESLRVFSYRPFETEPNMVLTISPAWKAFDDYLAALDTKYRKKIKDQNKKLSAAGCTVERVTDLAPLADRLHELYLAVQGNARVRLVTLAKPYLPALAATAGPDFRCTVIRRGDEILGFVTSIRDGETAIGYYIGFDRTAAQEGLPLYLRLLQATVADAIEWGCTRLSLGRTALEPKAGLGAKPEPMSVWVRHRVPPVNWLLRGLLSAVPHDEAPERNPFKEVATG